MKVSYKKMRELLVNRDILVADIIIKTSLFSCTMNKLKYDEAVNSTFLSQIATVLNCYISEIS